MRIVKLDTIIRACGFVCLFAFGTPALANEATKDSPPCPDGQSRAIVEVIESPAVIKDIYGKVQAIKTAGWSERVTPSVTKWIDIPENYVRPETVKINSVYRNKARYVPQYERYVFRKQSHDIVIHIDGRTDRRRVPTIWTQRVTYAIDPTTVTEKTTVTEIPYDPEKAEKNGKLRVIVTGPLTEGQSYSELDERDAIIGQERTPAKIRQEWGECVSKAPD